MNKNKRKQLEMCIKLRNIRRGRISGWIGFQVGKNIMLGNQVGNNINSSWEEYQVGKNIKFGRISSWEEYQVGKNIKLGRISSWKEYQVGKISSRKQYQLKLGRISSWEEYQVGKNNKLEIVKINFKLRKSGRGHLGNYKHALFYQG